MASSDKVLRWGICSAGNISFDFANALTILPASEQCIQAVAAREQTAAAEFAAKFGIPHAYGGYEQLAGDAHVDIVYVGVATIAHFEVCKLFLGAGKPVLCEKPLTCTAAQARELVALARTKGVFFMENMWTRTFPLMQRLRELVVENGVIGKVHGVQVNFGSDWRAVVPHLFDAKLGGGALDVVGVYVLQLSEWLFGERPERVYAVGKVMDGGDGVDGTVSVLLQHSRGRFSNATASICVDMKWEATVFGDSGNIRVEHPFHAPIALTVMPRQGEQYVISEPLPAGSKYGMQLIHSEGFAHTARHARECITQGLLESPLIPLSYSVWMMETIEECYKQIGRINYPK